MLYVLGLLTALQIVAAQTLWKYGLAKVGFTPTAHYIFSAQIVKAVFSPLVFGGIVLYGLATICFFILLSKYEYANAQTVVVVSSLTFTFLSALLIFNEKFNPVNVVGICLLLAGVILITRF
jgi:drug/metabolite transporter (DMT)-like permease